GLAIVNEEERRFRETKPARMVESVEIPAGKDVLIELAESTRPHAILFQHNDYYGRQDQLEQAARRYLDLLGSALLNELYLDHEMRLRYLRECVEDGKQPQRSYLGDPAHEMMRWERLAIAREAGTPPS